MAIFLLASAALLGTRATAQDYLSADEMLDEFPSCVRDFWADNVLYPQAQYCDLSPSTTPNQAGAQCLCLAGACGSTDNATLCADAATELGRQVARVCPTWEGVCDFRRAINRVSFDYCFDVIEDGTESVLGEGWLDAFEVSQSLPAQCASASMGLMPSLSAPATVSASVVPTGTHGLVSMTPTIQRSHSATGAVKSGLTRL